MASDLPNLRHLRAFAAVAALSSVNAGAEAVNLSQPAVTQAIAKLEAAFGAALIARRSSGSYTTEAGSILSARLARFFAQLRSAIGEAAGPSVRRDAGALSALEQRITVPQIRALITVAEAGSFAQAARTSRRAEPSLHRAARDVERLVGRPLFIRAVTGIGPNKGALELARRLKVAIREIDQAREEISALQGSVSARLAIASLPLARTLILPRTVNALLETYPDAMVEIVDGPYDNLLLDLRSGSVDFLIGAMRNPPPAGDVAESFLLDDPFAVVARRGHPLFGAAAVTPEAMAGFDWVVPRRGAPIRRAFEHLFAGVPKPPRIHVETSSLVVTRAILSETDRLTLLSRRQIAVEEAVGLLQVVPFPLPETSRPIGVTTRIDFLPSPIHRTFLDLLRLHARAQSEASTDPAAQMRRSR
ncbi:LysR family transcriptional regulator [Jiella sp. M17.18]|uniref:LysR family transcriptional regulator n=1 Tax=Jiella sp. M17.18 TaxID=3234247 RepID=UPI0034DFB84F